MTEKIFPAKLEELDNVLAFMEIECENAGCSPKDQMQINICLEEMFVNVAHYAYGDAEGDVLLKVSSENDEITITLEDSGKPYNPLEKEDPDITLTASERPIGGLGIYMTKKIMDEVSYIYEDGKNKFTMKKQIKGPVCK